MVTGDLAVLWVSHTSSQASGLVLPPAGLTGGVYEIAWVVGEVVPAGPEVTLLPHLNTNEKKFQGPQPRRLPLCS